MFAVSLVNLTLLLPYKFVCGVHIIFATDFFTISSNCGPFIIFLSTEWYLQSQGTPEQKAKWLPLAESYQIIGTYAQTELGHGNNLFLKLIMNY